MHANESPWDHATVLWKQPVRPFEDVPGIKAIAWNTEQMNTYGAARPMSHRQ
jgi:hypothetical protein